MAPQVPIAGILRRTRQTETGQLQPHRTRPGRIQVRLRPPPIPLAKDIILAGSAYLGWQVWPGCGLGAMKAVSQYLAERLPKPETLWRVGRGSGTHWRLAKIRNQGQLPLLTAPQPPKPRSGPILQLLHAIINFRR